MDKIQWVHVFLVSRHLSFLDLVHLSMTCKHLYSMLDNELRWQEWALREPSFPQDYVGAVALFNDIEWKRIAHMCHDTAKTKMELMWAEAQYRLALPMGKPGALTFQIAVHTSHGGGTRILTECKWTLNNVHVKLTCKPKDGRSFLFFQGQDGVESRAEAYLIDRTVTGNKRMLETVDVLPQKTLLSSSDYEQIGLICKGDKRAYAGEKVLEHNKSYYNGEFGVSRSARLGQVATKTVYPAVNVIACLSMAVSIRLETLLNKK